MGKGDHLEPVLLDASQVRVIRADLLDAARQLLEQERTLLRSASRLSAHGRELLKAADEVRAAALLLINMGKGMPDES